jgi:hypothetical protein
MAIFALTSWPSTSAVGSAWQQQQAAAAAAAAITTPITIILIAITTIRWCVVR